MGVDGKLEVDIELKCPAVDLFKLLVYEKHYLLLHHRDNAHTLDISDWYTPDSIKTLTYCLEPGCKKEVFMEKVTADELNETMELMAVAGHILEQYQEYKIVYQVSTKEGTGVVKLQLVYKKFKEADPDPNDYLKFLTKLLKDTDAHLFKKLYHPTV